MITPSIPTVRAASDAEADGADDHLALLSIGGKETALSDEPPQGFTHYMARRLKLQLADDDLPTLEQVVQANEEYLVTVDAASRTPSEDPLGFMRSVHTWRQTDEQ
jgi:hypothetical protein